MATDPNTYKFNFTQLRVKDVQESIRFYSFLGMSPVGKRGDISAMAYPRSSDDDDGDRPQQGVLSLQDMSAGAAGPSWTANNGNIEPHRGFGHVCVSVDNLQAACGRLEEAGYRFQKRLTDGRMRNIAFALDPDGYWIELIGQKPVEETERVTTTDMSTYKMNHTMIRVVDAAKSLAFYQDVLGMSLVRTIDNAAAGFSLYFVGYPGPGGPPSSHAEMEGLLELTWNHGTEKDASARYHSGNVEPLGFGHIAISVDNFGAACERLDRLGCEWASRPDEGAAEAMLLDPDKYWIKIVAKDRGAWGRGTGE